MNFDTLTTNTRDARRAGAHYDPPPRLVKGEEWGRFEFGSTLVMAAAPGALELDAAAAGNAAAAG